MDQPTDHAPTVQPLSEIVTRFESLGGGSLDAGIPAFGSEFGFFQRNAGAEPLGLLRWASIAPDALIQALKAGFDRVDDPARLEMIVHDGWDWAAVQTEYAIRLDHTHLDRGTVPADTARGTIAGSLLYLKGKLLDDLAAGEKIFVYRTCDRELPWDTLNELTAAVSAHGRNVLLYVTQATADDPAFSVRLQHPGLLIGYIDHFAPRNGTLVYNDAGWEAVCRRALTVLADPDCWRQALHDAQATGRAEDAAALLRDALGRFPDDDALHRDMAKAAEALGLWSEAAACWARFTVLRPGFWWSQAHQAEALFRAGQPAEADDVLVQAQQDYPDEPGLARDHARLAERTGAWAEAAARWSVAAARFPAHPEAPLGRARCLIRLGDAQEAEGILTDGADRFPDRPGFAQERARLAEAANDWTEAERWWREAVRRDPSVWWHHSGVANALLRQDKPQEAGAVLEAQFPILTREPHLFLEHARLAERALDWQTALDRARYARSRFPGIPGGYRGEAQALRELGRLKQARKVLNAALSRFPDDPDLLHESGKLADGMADWETSAAAWAAFVALRPQFWWGPTSLCRACWRLGRRPEAAAAYAASIEIVDEPAWLRRSFAQAMASDPPVKQDLAEYLTDAQIEALAQTAMDCEAWAVAEACLETL